MQRAQVFLLAAGGMNRSALKADADLAKQRQFMQRLIARRVRHDYVSATAFRFAGDSGAVISMVGLVLTAGAGVGVAIMMAFAAAWTRRNLMTAKWTASAASPASATAPPSEHNNIRAPLAT